MRKTELTAELCGMDSTHGMNLPNLPTFYIGIKGNCDDALTIVYFVIESDTGGLVAEALREIKRVLPELNPKTWIVDKNGPEIDGILTTFPDADA